MKYFSIFLFALFHFDTIYAQKYRSQSITVADGLSQGFVVTLFQDRRGFIWAGTADGLNRYDGYQIKRFVPELMNRWALHGNTVYCIAEDATGLLWLGTNKGLAVMDPYTERFVQLSDLNSAVPSGEIEQLHISQDGRAWFCHRQWKEDNVYVIQPPPNLVQMIREDQLQGSVFQVHPVQLLEGLRGPLMWLDMANDSAIVAADDRGEFCRIDPVALVVRKADPNGLPYQQWGKYGLLYSRQKTSGFVFSLHSGPDATTHPVAKFLQLPGETPIFCRKSTESLDPNIYQMDMASAEAGTIWPGNKLHHGLKSFYQLDRGVYSGLVDQAGNLWVGTIAYGIRKISRRKLDFKQYLPNTSFYNFTMLPDERVWPGLQYPCKVLNMQTGILENAPWSGLFNGHLSLSSLLVSRSGTWWMFGHLRDRAFILQKKRVNNQWEELPISINSPESIQTQMLEDRQRNIWIANVRGEILRIRPDNNQVDRWQVEAHFPASLAKTLFSNSLVEDGQGNLWIGCNYGLIRIKDPDGEPLFQVWHNYAKKGLIFKSESILSLYPDPDNAQLIWVGMKGGGLSSFDSRTGTCENFTEKDGLANNVVYGILPDNYGYLWLSTNRGLSRFSPGDGRFRNFASEDPNLNTEFNTGAYQRMPSGELAFGGVEGLFVIRPRTQQTEHPCLVEVTQLKINGINVDLTTVDDYFSLDAQNNICIEVPFDHNNIVIDFAALQTGDPTTVQYRYRLSELNKNWIPTGSQHSANLVAMAPGRYTIQLQGSSNDGNWANAPTTSVYVTILPPWYLSWPAWLAYGWVAFWLLYGYFRYKRRNTAIKHAVESSRKEMEQLQALKQFKNRFFGYISHEFKTPLTLIIGHARRLPEEQNLHKGVIVQQGQSMLEMVDQIVDITRLGNQNLTINWRNGNFSEYVHYLVESLRSLAEFKDIHLDFQTAVPDLVMDFDPLRLKYIINNLLDNAVRHTPPGGYIAISVLSDEPHQVGLQIVDSGEGIAPEDLPHIFERYYQGNSNYPESHHFGLGLAFVKDLVQLFKGTIAVSSQPGSRTAFYILLPVTQNAPPLETSFSELVLPRPNSNVQALDELPRKSLPLLLIVEDNIFISNFLRSTLDAYFRLEHAADGLAGYEKAMEIVPDLILTDVMMPRMDGYELTRRLKGHELTGHIPIVMLSARSGLSDRLSGQQLGADAYIGKPFDEQEIILILQNLHRLQQRWRERYAELISQTGAVTVLENVVLEHPQEVVQQTDAFMLKIYDLFAKNYKDENYDRLRFCHDLKMSRSQLQRKLAVLSSQSSMELLRHYRLQKAYELLLENPDINVEEICFQVGFKDRSHFSRLFSKTFQMAPSEVRKKAVDGSAPTLPSLQGFDDLAGFGD